MKYRKKPVVIEATRMPTVFDYEAIGRVACWMVDHGYVAPEAEAGPAERFPECWHNGKPLPFYGDDHLSIVTLEGIMTAMLGDWIIRGVKGEFYPCKNDIFLDTYEVVFDDE